MSNYKNFNISDIADVFKALSNPNRLKIFSQMVSHCKPGTCCSPADVEKCCVGDLGKHLNISPSTLSHHIKELNRAGLIKTERRGQHIDCWVDKEIVEMLQGFFTEESLQKIT